MRNLVSVTFVGLMIAACGGSAPDSSQSNGQATVADEQTGSNIFDMPYLMRDLENDLRVIIVKTDFPDIVTLQIPVQTGSRNEVEAGKSGFAHFFEHMMFRGTDQYSTEEYQNILTKAGVQANAFTSDDFTNYYMTFTKPDLEKMIEIEADRFQNLNYSEADFRTEALAVKGEYLKNYSNPINKAYERLREISFGTHPYGHTTMGYIADIEAMPDQLDYSKTFFDRWYRPEFTSVIIVGDVDPESTFDLVEKYWSGWKRGEHTADIPEEPPASSPVYEHMQWEGDTQPWLLIGYRGPAFEPIEKDMPAMSLVESVYFSDSSDLYQKLVIEDQYVDSLNTDFSNTKDSNILMVYVRLTDESYATQVEAAINATFERARTEKIDAETLNKTKSRLRYSFASRLDASERIGGILARFVHFDRTPETINQLYKSYDNLTADDIQRLAGKYFDETTRVMVSLSTSGNIPGVGVESLDSDPKTVPGSDTPELMTATSMPEIADELFAPNGEPVAVPIIANPSDTSALVDVSLLFDAGSGMDPEGQKGLASLTAAMLTEAGSAVYSIQAINDAMYPIASGFHAQVDKEMTRLSGQVHKDNLETWYRYSRSQLMNPGWSEQDFKRIQTQLINRIRASLVANNDEELGKEVLYSRIYGDAHPYGSLNYGHSSDIANLTLDDVRRFYANYYTTNNVSIGLSGGYPDSFADQLSRDLQSLPKGERSKLDVPVATLPEGSKAIIVEKETSSVAVSFGFPIELKRGDPDWVALWLMRSYLGEHRAASGKLYKQIREARGMNYGNYAYIEYFPNGMFGFQPATNIARQQQIFQVWIRPLRSNNDAHFATRTAVREIKNLVDEGMTESDFEATRAFLSKFVSLMTDGQSRQLGYEMDSQYYGTAGFADYVRDGLNQLTLADVNRVMRENLDLDNMQYVFVAKDAADLKNRLVTNQRSTAQYDAEMPEDLLLEDRQIESFPLNFSADDVVVTPAAEIFN